MAFRKVNYNKNKICVGLSDPVAQCGAAADSIRLLVLATPSDFHLMDRRKKKSSKMRSLESLGVSLY